MKIFVVTVLGCLALTGCASACGGHDSVCHGANGAQGDCCGGMHCQKNDPSWAEGRCYFNPGSGDEDVSTSSSNSTTFSWSSLPISSCDPSVGQLCLPNACEKNHCELMSDAKCLADRCGCEARFFKWNDKTKVFQDYSRMCHVSNHLAEVQRFIKDDGQNDEPKADSKDLVELYRTFNSLTVEVLLDIARFLQDVVKSDPSEKNLAKLRGVLNVLQALHNATARAIADQDDTLTEKRFPPNHFERHHHHHHGHPSKVIIKKFRDTEDTLADQEDSLSEEPMSLRHAQVRPPVDKHSTKVIIKKKVSDTEDAPVRPVKVDPKKVGAAAVRKGLRRAADEEIQNRKFLDILKKGWNIAKKFLDEDASTTTTDTEVADEHNAEERIFFLPIIKKVVKKLISDEGKFSDEIKSGQVAISDKNVRDKLSSMADEITSKAITIRIKWYKGTENDFE